MRNEKMNQKNVNSSRKKRHQHRVVGNNQEKPKGKEKPFADFFPFLLLFLTFRKNDSKRKVFFLFSTVVNPEMSKSSGLESERQPIVLLLVHDKKERQLEKFPDAGFLWIAFTQTEFTSVSSTFPLMKPET